MNHHASSFIVVFEDDIDKDDVDRVVELLGMLQGVIAVKPVASDPVAIANEFRAKHDLRTKIMEMLK